MKPTPLIINWHDSTSPVYSAHFEPYGKGRLATGGGDNNVRVCSGNLLSFSVPPQANPELRRYGR